MTIKPASPDVKISACYHFARLVMAFVFIYASLDKIAHPGPFAQAVFNYQILPDRLINLTALILPWLELILGVCLLLNRWMSGASFLAGALMAVFMGAMAFNLARGLDISCGCFSTDPGEGPISLPTLLRDMLFLVLSLVLAGLTMTRNTRRLRNSSMTS